MALLASPACMLMFRGCHGASFGDCCGRFLWEMSVAPLGAGVVECPRCNESLKTSPSAVNGVIAPEESLCHQRAFQLLIFHGWYVCAGFPIDNWLLVSRHAFNQMVEPLLEKIDVIRVAAEAGFETVLEKVQGYRVELQSMQEEVQIWAMPC